MSREICLAIMRGGPINLHRRGDERSFQPGKKKKRNEGGSSGTQGSEGEPERKKPPEGHPW